MHFKGSRTALRLRNESRTRIAEQKAYYRPAASRHYSDLRSRGPTQDGRARLSGLWVPIGGIAEAAAEDSHSKLIRAGFLRQAHSGIFHMLPLGRRVQEKLEALIDKYMSKLNASKVSLSSISSEELWARSGRLSGVGSELFRFKDRKDAGYLLAPTHEEEITVLVSSTASSYKKLPIRLYQISRKYRDERRPRQGLLRSREFIMKDLYTFDHSISLALATYHEVREVYAKLFDELKIPYLVADADSGNMGGTLSHEFHFPTPKGEDHVISCDRCDYVANEELAEAAIVRNEKKSHDITLDIGQGTLKKAQLWRGISHDRKTLVNVWYHSPPEWKAAASDITEVNVHAIKAAVPDLDASIEDPLPLWKHHASQSSTSFNRATSKSFPSQILDLIHFETALAIPTGPLFDGSTVSPQLPQVQSWNDEIDMEFEAEHKVRRRILRTDPKTGKFLNLLRIRDGDSCSRCSDGKLKVQKAIELGHTFHLGTRYSEPLEALVMIPKNLVEDHTKSAEESYGGDNTSRKVPMQMGCHGIGVSRIIGAVADTLSDEKGLNWPRVMAPYEVVVIPARGNEDAALEVYDSLSSAEHGTPLDLILDDRAETLPWKMGDADLIGYPVIVIVGKKWNKEGVCEVQCRRLGIRQDCLAGTLPTFVRSLLDQL